MADVVKVGILEKNGVEIDQVEEHLLLAEEVPFDNSTNGFTATLTQGAIEEAKASSGLPDFIISNDTCLLFKIDGGFVIKG